MRFKRKALVGVGLILYGVLSLAVGFEAGALDLAEDRVPTWTAPIIVTAIGPAVFLNDGFAGWHFYLVSLVAIIVCLALAWETWKRWPDSEVFLVGLLTAAGLWCGCGWFAVALLI
jgi:hypothetical protein